MGLDEKGKCLLWGIWKFEESCEGPGANWFQPASEVGSMEIYEIARLFPVPCSAQASSPQ